MFGFAILNDDYVNSEWGYVDYKELIDLNINGFEVERDLHWEIKKAGLVERIAKAVGFKFLVISYKRPLLCCP